MPRRQRHQDDDTYLDYWTWYYRQEAQRKAEASASKTLDALSLDETPKPRIYRSLSNDFEEIRLVILLPATDPSSPIECRLEHAKLGQSRPYEALSYVWGKPDFLKEILLDAQPFLVRPNLESALRQLRKPSVDRVLWIDAICIDQTNLSERGLQIQLMRGIFSQCTRDLLWLGPEDESTIRGIQILKKLEGFKLADIESLSWRRSDYRIMHQDTVKTTWYPSEGDWSILTKLLRILTIWERVWIIQEMSSAPNVLLVCGSTTLDWMYLERLLDGGTYSTDAFHSPFGHDSSNLTDLFETAQVIKTQRSISRSLAEGVESSLLDVLARFRFTVATDKKDKVFALLGLVSDDLGVLVDYTKSTVDIYIDTTRRLINSSRNLDIICQSQWQMFANEARESGLPSWVPDFSAPGQGRFLFAQRSIFAASAPECEVPVTISKTAISLSGVILGELDQLPGDTYDDFRRTERVLGMTWGHKQRLHTLEWASSFGYPKEKSPAPYRTGETKFRAFCRTLAADCTAFPMRRLTQPEIDQDETLLARCCENVEDGPYMGDMTSFRMISELQSHWRFGITSNGLFALVPFGSQKGDVIAVLDGAKVPVVLRAAQREASQTLEYQVIGGSYVHGFMNGEATDSDEFEKEILVIV